MQWLKDWGITFMVPTLVVLWFASALAHGAIVDARHGQTLSIGGREIHIQVIPHERVVRIVQPLLNFVTIYQEGGQLRSLRFVPSIRVAGVLRVQPTDKEAQLWHHFFPSQ